MLLGSTMFLLSAWPAREISMEAVFWALGIAGCSEDPQPAKRRAAARQSVLPAAPGIRKKVLGLYLSMSGAYCC